MKVILIFVSTVDGKVTRWGDPHVRDWSSAEDQQYYAKIWKGAGVIVMGSHTFSAEKFTPSPDRLLVVMTSHLSKYSQYAVSGQIEFTDSSPRDLVTRFRDKGMEALFVVGGPRVGTSFLEDQLIDELWLTIEPKIFGSGGNLVIEEKLDIGLRMTACERVNEQGTLIIRYTVLKK
jgi:dihydrofolate reductase